MSVPLLVGEIYSLLALEESDYFVSYVKRHTSNIFGIMIHQDKHTSPVQEIDFIAMQV